MTQQIQQGSEVSIDYTLKVDGEVVDSSEGRGPLSYTQGQGQIIPGLEKELTGMSVGESKHVTVAPEEGYGAPDPRAVIDVPRAELPPDLSPEAGQVLQGMDQSGRPFQAKVQEVGPETVKLDFNHPLAGKTLDFDVKVVTVENQPAP